MITAVLYIDLVLIGLILIWLTWINITGTADQKSGAGLAAFMMVSLIAFWSLVIVLADGIINLIWN